MTSKSEWIKELKSWIANSKSYKKFCERQIHFWANQHSRNEKQLRLQEGWLKEAKAKKEHK